MPLQEPCIVIIQGRPRYQQVHKHLQITCSQILPLQFRVQVHFMVSIPPMALHHHIQESPLRVTRSPISPIALQELRI